MVASVRIKDANGTDVGPVVGLTDSGYHVMLQDKDGSKLEWVVARAGKNVVGIGDEEFIVQPGMTTSDASWRGECDPPLRDFCGPQPRSRSRSCPACCAA